MAPRQPVSEGTEINAVRRGAAQKLIHGYAEEGQPFLGVERRRIDGGREAVREKFRHHDPEGAKPSVIDRDHSGSYWQSAGFQTAHGFLQADNRNAPFLEESQAPFELALAHEQEIGIVPLAEPDAVIAEYAQPAAREPAAHREHPGALGDRQQTAPQIVLKRSLRPHRACSFDSTEKCRCAPRRAYRSPERTPPDGRAPCGSRISRAHRMYLHSRIRQRRMLLHFFLVRPANNLD